jgi:hypothetical protein
MMFVVTEFFLIVIGTGLLLCGMINAFIGELDHAVRNFFERWGKKKFSLQGGLLPMIFRTL